MSGIKFDVSRLSVALVGMQEGNEGRNRIVYELARRKRIHHGIRLFRCEKSGGDILLNEQHRNAMGADRWHLRHLSPASFFGGITCLRPSFVVDPFGMATEIEAINKASKGHVRLGGVYVDDCCLIQTPYNIRTSTYAAKLCPTAEYWERNKGESLYAHELRGPTVVVRRKLYDMRNRLRMSHYTPDTVRGALSLNPDQVLETLLEASQCFRVADTTSLLKGVDESFRFAVDMGVSRDEKNVPILFSEMPIELYHVSQLLRSKLAVVGVVDLASGQTGWKAFLSKIDLLFFTKFDKWKRKEGVRLRDLAIRPILGTCSNKATTLFSVPVTKLVTKASDDSGDKDVGSDSPPVSDSASGSDESVLAL